VHSHALVLGPDGVLYGTQVHATRAERSVWRLDAAGRMATVLAARDALPLGLQSFLASADGTVYSASPFQHPAPADGRRLYLVRRAPHGAVDTVAGGRVGHADGTGPSARFEGIDGMAWLPDGSMVVADGTRLRRVTLGGEVTTLGAPLTRRAGGEDLLGVAPGPGGSVLVADFAGRAVWRVTTAAVARVHGPGRFWSPTGVAAVGDELYVLEHPRAPFGLLGDLGVGPYLKLHHRDGSGRWTVLAVRWGEHSRTAALLLALFAGAVAALVRRRRRRRHVR
jgi:hypothetical protein